MADGGVGQAVGLGITLTGDVRDGKLQRPGQLATNPVQRIQARAATGILAAHLPDHDLGIRIDVQCLGLQRQSTLQRLKQGNVFRDIVVLAPNPAGNADGAARTALNYYANTGRPRISQRTAIHVGHKVRHQLFAVTNMRQNQFSVKTFIRFACNSRRALWNSLWKTRVLRC